MATTGEHGARPDHGALMDSVYRGQRHIYDITRKYYLFGRDRLVAGLDASPGAAIIEVGCGTGRNLALIGRRWPGAHLFGLDVSAEMLRSASARLGDTACLALGDATAFDSAALLGRESFDRVVFSYVLSMIPNWQAALDTGAALLAPGGSLHAVDFGDFDGLPGPLESVLRAWLTRFHVTPRAALADAAAVIAALRGLEMRTVRGHLGYYRMVTLTRPAD